MESLQMVKQFIDANKMVFENTMDLMAKGQQQAEATVDAVLDTHARFAQETKQTMEKWAKLTRKGCDDLKEISDKGLQAVQQFFNVS